jgi:electron transfer flavoprotein beta subunit
VVTMGPPMAEEVLHHAKALGADEGILLTDRRMAGADTFLTSHILASCIRRHCADFDLILCGCQTSDSETAQVAPQLADDLDVPAITFAQEILLEGNSVRVQRHVDDFFEELQMTLPGLISVDLNAYAPRYLALDGVEQAFVSPVIQRLDARQLDLGDEFNALRDSPTRIVEVYSPTNIKKNHVLKGAVKTVVDQLLETYGKVIGGAMGKDLEAHPQPREGQS